MDIKAHHMEVKLSTYRVLTIHSPLCSEILTKLAIIFPSDLVFPIFVALVSSSPPSNAQWSHSCNPLLKANRPDDSESRLYSVTPQLKSLSELFTVYQISSKLLLLAYKAIYHLTPVHLITHKTPTPTLQWGPSLLCKSKTME